MFSGGKFSDFGHTLSRMYFQFSGIFPIVLHRFTFPGSFPAEKFDPGDFHLGRTFRHPSFHEASVPE